MNNSARLLTAIKLIRKYVTIEETGDDLFPYRVVDKQYVSSRSCVVISKDDYEYLMEILK